MQYRKFVLPAVVLAGSIVLGANIPRILNNRHAYASGNVRYSQGMNASPAAREIESALYDRTKSTDSIIAALDSTKNNYGADEFARAAIQAVPNMPRLSTSSMTGKLIFSLFTSAVGERNNQLMQNPEGYNPNNPLDYAAMASRPGGIKVGQTSYASTRVPDVYRNLATGKFERRDGRRMVDYTVPVHNGRPVDVDDPRVDVANNAVLEDKSPVQRGYEVKTPVTGGESAIVYQSNDDYLQRVTAERVAKDPVIQGLNQLNVAGTKAGQRANDAATHAGRAVDNFIKSLDNGKKR
ncbi:MAG TPA: hypothetical protein VI968_01865 [archaeon]|nr:hypothetical protein [archaeon]